MTAGRGWLVRLAAGLVLVAAGWADAPRPPWRPRSMAYVLQAEKLDTSRARVVERLTRCGRELIVLDASYTAGGAAGRWTAAELARIRAGKPGRKVLAYLSIGEAEDYRDYWNKAWDANRDGRPDRGAPAFLEPVNPDWQGNYKVRYWHAAWQALILAEAGRIAGAGFDGIYLDIVDAFEHFERSIDGRKNPETGRSYREEMCAWVLRLAAHTRRRADDGFRIVPQNGQQLLADPAYRRQIDAIAIEDLFTAGDRRQEQAHTAAVLRALAANRRPSVPLLIVEYPRAPALAELVRREAERRGLVWLLTDRDLTGLGRSGG